ncbi:hypothetical protein G7054_g3861 [Neopestalotiopsis clavispora]|nr:hypothetical protein G7054_g3861 [Neopestalotiopsis clavispora]
MASTSDPAQDAGTNSPRQSRSFRFWAIIVSLMIASLLSALDVSVISTAMPSMVHDLGSNYAFIWIVNAYFLTMTAFQPIYGQTANIFGRRSLTLLAVSLFAIGSAVSGSAPNLGALIVGRAIQGIGGGGINILIEIVVADLLPLRQRPKFISIIFTAYTVAVVLGPVIVSGVALIMLFAVLRVQYKKDSMRNSLKRVDFGGNALLIASVVSVLLALTWGGVEFAWSSWRTILPLVLGVLGIGSFIGIESTQWIPEPTMPIRSFSNRTSLGGFAVAFIHSMLTYWITYFMPLYFQAVLRTDAITSGVNILPMAAVAMPFAMIAGFGLSKFGRYRPWFFLGYALFAVSFGLFSRLDEKSSTAYWAGSQCIGAAAAGILTTTTLPCIQAPLSEVDQAVATATWGFVRSFGGVWGVAIPAAIFNSQVNSLVKERLQDKELQSLLSNGGAYALASGGQIGTIIDDPLVNSQVNSIFVDSLRLCWQVGIGFSALGFFISAIVKEVTMRTHLETDFGLEERKKESGN